MKKIVILGSSGGNLYNLGGADPEKLLSEIYTQCQSAGVSVAAVQFIAAQASMDVAKPSTAAAVYTLTEADAVPAVTFSGTLAEVNDAVRGSDEQIARLIEQGDIDGIIIMSGDPHNAAA